jgi:hypothetical protein
MHQQIDKFVFAAFGPFQGRRKAAKAEKGFLLFQARPLGF